MCVRLTLQMIILHAHDHGGDEQHHHLSALPK